MSEVEVIDRVRIPLSRGYTVRIEVAGHRRKCHSNHCIAQQRFFISKGETCLAVQWIAPNDFTGGETWQKASFHMECGADFLDGIVESAKKAHEAAKKAKKMYKKHAEKKS